LRAFEDDSDSYAMHELNNASDTVTLGDMVPDEMSDLRSALVEAEAEREERQDADA
jgi:hypothetical protein